MRSVPRLLSALLVLAAGAAAQDRPDPALAAADWHGRAVVAGELLVQFRAGTSAAQRAALPAQLGGETRGALPGGLTRVSLPAGVALDEQLALYASRPEVQFAQPNVLHRPVDVPNDPHWPLQWGLPKVGAPAAWDTFAGDPSVVVAVIDSGVDVDHPDLAAHLAWGSDPFAGDGNPDDSDGHGTHCAGIAAALTGNGAGVAGAAPGCRFAAYRCGNETFPTWALVTAINDAVAQGACVLSMSWGSSFNDIAIRSALQAALAQGCLLVAAAGNDGATAPFYPAAHPFVLAVGASTPADARASFSNHGPWVDLAAPGQSIYSTWKAGAYKYLSGTSMACPLVAGAGALLYARLGPRTPANAALVRAALEDSAVPVGDWVEDGRLDVAAAMALLFPPAPPVLLAVDPALVPALHGVPVTLTGSGLLDVTEVLVDGVPVAFGTASNTALVFTAPDATALGPAVVAVSGPAGAASTGLHRVPTVPPRLEVPAVTPAGAPCTWSAGGDVGDDWYLLLGLQPDTFVHSGHELLVPVIVLHGGQLDETGLGWLSALVPAGAAGQVFRSQLVTWDQGLAGASDIEITAIE